MSKRRGKVLTDVESVERRSWYAGLQKATLEEVEKEKESFRQEQIRETQSKAEQIPVHAGSRQPICSEENKWLVKLATPRNPTAVIICFPGISQAPGYFCKWRPYCNNAGIFLGAICSPGRANRAAEPCATSVRDTAISVFLTLKSQGILERVQHSDDSSIANRPLVFVGHDVGCLVAYEVAKLLQDYKYTHTALVMAACPSPYQQGQNKYGKKMCFLSDQELYTHMVALGGVPKILLGRRDILNYFIPLFRSDYYLYDKYVITPPATVLSISEGEIANALLSASAPAPAPATPSKPVPRSTSPGTNKGKPVAGGKAPVGKARVVKEELPEEEEELVYPVVLYRLRCAIVTLLVDGDPFVSAKDVAEWVHMSNNHEHVQLESPGPGGHMTGLFTAENEAQVLSIIGSYCVPVSAAEVPVESDS